MTRIIYIHGAFSTGLSFARIKENLPEHEALLPEYTVDMPLQDVVNSVDSIIKESKVPVHIVSHSLGGLIGVAVAQRNNLVQSVVTMSSPFGGSPAADTLKWFSSHQMFKSLDRSGTVLRNIHNNLLPCPVRCIITTSGNNPMILEHNDGVVSVKSQMALKSAERLVLDVNHFEVLLSDASIQLIKDFVFK